MLVYQRVDPADDQYQSPAVAQNSTILDPANLLLDSLCIFIYIYMCVCAFMDKYMFILYIHNIYIYIIHYI